MKPYALGIGVAAVIAFATPAQAGDLFKSRFTRASVQTAEITRYETNDFVSGKVWIKNRGSVLTHYIQCRLQAVNAGGKTIGWDNALLYRQRGLVRYSVGSQGDVVGVRIGSCFRVAW